MARAIGIDLGERYAVMAHTKKQEAKVIDNQAGKSRTPCVVHVTERGEVVVGELAKTAGGRAPAETVFSIKRFMGREFKDPAIQEEIRRAPYKVVEASNGEVEVVLRGRRYSPPEITAFILSALKRDAEAALDERVTHTVITVPAYFGARQREATRLAGRLAGLNVMRLISEPAAAALAYGFESDMTESKTVLVYDLGGGTFDVTVMDIAAGVFDDRGKTGDMHLGGDDFDHKIMDWIIDQVRAQHRTDLRALPNASEVLFHLKQKAEEAKIRLARQLRTQIVIPNLAKVGGQFIDIECELTRDHFNRMIQADVKRSIDLVFEAVRKAGVTPASIDAVLLVGGSTRIPLVEDSLRQIFGDRVIRGDVNPMHCVAQGAAIQTLYPEEEEERMPIRIKHPYADTPYDVLSDPTDPKVGVVTPDTPRQALRAQKARVLAQRKRDNRDIAEADRALMSIIGRLGCDVFLRTTLDRSGDIKELIEKHREPPTMAQANPDWTQGLSYWLEPPVGEIPLQPIQITHSTSYDDPRADLTAVEFDL